jgi:hypothetical protein
MMRRIRSPKYICCFFPTRPIRRNVAISDKQDLSASEDDMNLDVLKIATIPLKLVDFDPGRTQAKVRIDNHRRRCREAEQWSATHGVAAYGIEPAEPIGPRRHAHVGEGRTR